MLPWVYFAFAHACLLLALAVVVVNPDFLGTFFYHPRALGLVHLITLGWISCNILGSLYLVGPVALRVTFRAGPVDAAACACVAIGVSGMVAHFWIDRYSGMIWSAGTVLLGLVLVAGRLLPTLVRAPIPAPVRAHIALAFVNLLAAGLLGSLVGLEKLGVLALPGRVLPGVLAHAHLAGLGWATMMVMGVGYRLLPMLLPAAAPPAARMWPSVILLQLGVAGLVPTLMISSRWSWPFAVAALSGVAAFLVNVVWMLRHRRPSPGGLTRPDLAAGHTLQALAYLLVCSLASLVLLADGPAELDLSLGFAYGVAALLGFLSQIVLGVGARLLPMVSWIQGFVRSGFQAPGVSQYDIFDRRAQAVVLAMWTLGVPSLAGAVFVGSLRWQQIAAALLLLGAIVDGWNRVGAYRAARRTLT